MVVWGSILEKMQKSKGDEDGDGDGTGDGDGERVSSGGVSELAHLP